jgi:hypothetical protein
MKINFLFIVGIIFFLSAPIVGFAEQRRKKGLKPIAGYRILIIFLGLLLLSAVVVIIGF